VKFRLLALLCCAACTPRVLPEIDAGTSDAGTTRPPVHAHAHNDYEHTRPLLDALDQRFDSVEADIYWSGSDIGVSHDGPPFKGTLKELYLDPLQARVEANSGSVHGDGKPFFLWLDFKDSSTDIQNAVATQLAGYAMLTRFEDDREVPGAVTVVLTGGGAKGTLANRAAPRFWIRDSNNYSDTDPPADLRWGYYAVNYYSFLAWPGDGATIPAAQKKQLKNLIDGAHAKGRKIRIYSSPDSPAYWRAAHELGLDFINADDLTGLRATLDEP
jgi:hypothetical protein